jgi:aldose 1-epimerase
MTQPVNYSVRRETVDGMEVVRLSDSASRTEVSIAPAIGNMAYEMLVGGRNILWFPYQSPAELKRDPTLCAVPFLAPWANRIDGEAYWANGKRYTLNPALGNLRRDGNGLPIHGLLNFSPAWSLVSVEADDSSASASSLLEFWRHPDMMAQFPFAHSIAMTYRLTEGALEVETAIANLCTEPMPLAIGYHPYFRLHDAPRDQWKVRIAARTRLELNDRLIPTGKRAPAGFAGLHKLAEAPLDDVFTDLIREPDGTAVFRVEGERQAISVAYGPKYPIAVVYAPAGRDFICFEPMAAVTNAFNLAHDGLCEVQSIPPGGRWREIFRISTAGF